MLAGVCIGIGRDTVDVLLRRVLLGWHIVLTCIDGRRAFQRCCDGSTSYCLPYYTTVIVVVCPCKVAPRLFEKSEGEESSQIQLIPT